MPLLEKLKQYLVSKPYRPGERIPTEMELAGRFGVSRGKIREATTALCLQGVLDKKARRGTVVKSLDPDSAGRDLLFRFSLSDVDPAEFHEARKVIERAIMPLTVRRITPVQLRELEELVNRMETRISEPTVADIADRDFHLLLLKACGNQALQTFGQVIQALFREQYRRKYWTAERLAAAVADHRRLLAALRDSDEAAAVDLITHHFRE